MSLHIRMITLHTGRKYYRTRTTIYHHTYVSIYQNDCFAVCTLGESTEVLVRTTIYHHYDVYIYQDDYLALWEKVLRYSYEYVSPLLYL